MKKDEQPVVVEQNFNVPATVVWKAITELNQMHQWYFETIPTFEPVVGFECHSTLMNEGRKFTHL